MIYYLLKLYSISYISFNFIIPQACQTAPLNVCTIIKHKKAVISTHKNNFSSRLCRLFMLYLFLFLSLFSVYLSIILWKLPFPIILGQKSGVLQDISTLQLSFAISRITHLVISYKISSP